MKYKINKILIKNILFVFIINNMECSICFESKKENKFILFLKKNNVDVCKNNYKCIDNICINCIINHIHNPLFYINNCPLCRNDNFKYLDRIYYIFCQIRLIYKSVKNISNNNDKNIINRIHKIFMQLIKSFDDCIININNNDEYIVNYYFDDLESDIKDFKKIIKKLK